MRYIFGGEQFRGISCLRAPAAAPTQVSPASGTMFFGDAAEAIDACRPDQIGI
jgi:hypothetical protein